MNGKVNLMSFLYRYCHINRFFVNIRFSGCVFYKNHEKFNCPQNRTV